MKNLGIQNIIIGIFVIAGIIAIFVFSGFIDIGSSNETAAKGKVLVWGTVPYTVMQKYIDQSKGKDLSITYAQQDPQTYEYNLINAMAAGTGPDLFIMSHEAILRNKDKIFEVPYETIARRDYTNRYIRSAEIFLTDTGVLAQPVVIDPLVLYYNKSLLNSAFIVNIPKYWDEVTAMVPALTKADGTGRITISGIGLGTFDNLDESKAILAELMIQNDNRLVGVDPSSGKYRSLLGLDTESFEKTKQSLEYFTSFANIEKANYTWNEALPRSLDMFIAGDLALYIGRASELTNIRKKNPNLDFDLTFLPQVRDTTRISTFGYLTGIAISKQTKNIAASLSVASSLSGAPVTGPLSAELGQAPARFDLLQNKPEDPYLGLFFQSAQISDTWVDPDPSSTNELFRNLIRNLNAGATTIGDAITRTHTDLNTLLDSTINTTIVDKNLQGLN
jgi:ABC-type glycerol-3-phosphate transport system substrate-binding protein